MSIGKKSNNSDGQIQNTVWFSSQTRRVYCTPVIACHFIKVIYFFYSKEILTRNFGVFVVFHRKLELQHNIAWKIGKMSERPFRAKFLNYLCHWLQNYVLNASIINKIKIVKWTCVFDEGQSCKDSSVKCLCIIADFFTISFLRSRQASWDYPKIKALCVSLLLIR